MRKYLINLLMILLSVSMVSATTNLDFRLDVEDKGFYPNEKVPLNVTIVNRDITFAARDAVLTVNIGDRFYTFDLGDLEPGEVFQKEIILPEFPAGTHNIKGEINYTGILDERFVEVSYGSFEVLFPPIERYPRNVYVSGYDLPEKIISGKSYDVSITITNDGEISADLLIEFGSMNEFFTEKTTLNPGKSTTVKMVVRFGTPGVSLIEARAYALIKGEKYLLNYRGRKTYVQAERKAKLIFDRIELVGEGDNEINQEDVVKFKVFIKNEGDTATGVRGELSSSIEKINVLDSSVSYVTIASKDNVAPFDDVFEIETKGVDTGDYELNLKLSYVDSENREKKIQIPITISEGGDSCTKDVDCLNTQTCENNRCVEVPCECGYIKNRKCVHYQCCFDSQCKKDMICNQKTHKCEVPATILRDVLIVTIGKKIGKTEQYESVLNQYRKSLLEDGYSSFYIELDSKKVEELFKVRLSNHEDWVSVKTVLDKIIDKVRPSHILILGGFDVIPQPFIKNNCFKDMNLDSLPTDDLYADTTNDKTPDLAIGRIPTTGKHLVNYLKNLENIHSTGILFNKETLLGNYCEGDSCFEKPEAEKSSKLLFGSECSRSGKCLWSPPHCETTGMPPITPIPCSKSKELYSILEKSDFIYLVLHGDGTAFYSARYKAGPIPIIGDTVLSGVGIKNFLDFKSPTIIMAISCLGGSIDVASLCLLPGACLYPKITGKYGTAKSLIDKGVIFIANTRYGLGGYTTTQMTNMYHKMRDKEEIGKALLNMKSEMFKKSSNECWLAAVYQIQLYGDPTLRYKEGEYNEI